MTEGKIGKLRRKFRVLVAPLDWGLGHATRCVPIVRELLENDCEVWLAGETSRATAGTTFHFPRHTPHGFQNVGATSGKTLWNVVPGANFEPFFDELGALPPGPPDLAKVAAIFGKYDIQILPPPDMAQS